MNALEYARAACETMMRRYAAPELPPVGRFHYHQGVFLSGMYETWKLCREEKYFTYMKDWVDSVFDHDGRILKGVHADLDDIQPGILLFPLLDRTGDPFYSKCLESVWQEVKDIPVNAEGGYWHKTTLKDQMWLDGLYMAGPFCAEYAARFHRPQLSDTVVWQAKLMAKKTRDARTGLWYHAWDGTGTTPWADSVTGCSHEFWGRSMGWVPVALLNDLDYLDETVEDRMALRDLAVDLLRSLCRFQSEDGRWYQVVDKGGQPDNWLENSCSCLYVAALCKAMRLGFMPAEYAENARRGYDGVIRSLTFDGDDLLVGNVCIGTGVGDYAFYCARPVNVNDLHGVGAFLLMCTEMERFQMYLETVRP
ncbi:MAG: glycoside hydrolase family 88 protein [Clostridia bacterium]|nr:glycoside hydrolase family 88 protein [Clostridia bacterium]